MTRKIDLYCEGDCWDPKLWSATPYELATTLKKMGLLHNTCNVNPLENESFITHYLSKLSYLHIDKKGVCTLQDSIHPRRYRVCEKKALEFYESNPKPDSIITIGHLAIFHKTPYFTLQDLDTNTVLKWRKEKKTTYMLDRIPISILEKNQKIQQEVYENAAGIFVSSEWVRKNICSYISEPRKVFTTGIGHRYSTVELTEEILRERFENPVLLFIGKEGIRKGVDAVIEAFQQIKNEFKNMKLRIVTNQDLLPKQVKKSINRTPEVELYSNISSKELSDMYMSSSLFVMPSRFEPFGKVFFEAMAFGLPVIGANHCAMPEFITNDYNGYTSSVNSEEIAERVKQVFESFKTYKKLSKNAISVSEKYREENVVAEMLSIIDRYSS
ncbi:glycosyltransferase family 1 protein [Methanosarcina sp. MSH10X1]|uniref:glycosyltransferase family 4 protein n=1 Tax=Methanosarcina sp. MSH10X1 TaxID=2507075 RepID=UPI000FFB8049|nr:glycosyltransferase [Methanosarcina sp. MSH10X1]RXA19350.1 glycosyltransferase family 1 protein [Methanosarcina sp. MSH10X1]